MISCSAPKRRLLISLLLLVLGQFLVSAQNMTSSPDYVSYDSDYEEEFDYMEEEDQILNRRWRSEFLFGEDENAIDGDYDWIKRDFDHRFSLFDIDGRRRSTGGVFGHFSRINNSYVIMAPLIARPHSVYRLVILPYRVEDSSKPIEIKATMSSIRGAEITYGVSRGFVGDSTEILLKLPGALPGPHIRLHVEGRQEGSLLFVNSTMVHPSNDFLTIVVSMSRPIFNGNQQVDFRVILLQTDMLPYQEPVDIYILDSTGYAVRRWVSRMPNTGVVALNFWTPALPAGGYWRVRVQAGTQRKDHPFLVIKYFIPRFEIMWDFDPYFLATDEFISGEVQAVVTNDAPVYGNLTITTYVKHPWTLPDSEYKPINYHIEDYIPGSYEFSLPMEYLEGVVPELEGAEVKFEVKVLDRFSGLTVSGFAKTRIILGEVIVKFIGPTPWVFKPGMPNTFVVNVAFEDNESLDPDRLLGSSLKITAQATLETGASVHLPEIYISPEGDDTEAAEAFMNINEIGTDYNYTLDGEYEIWYNKLRFESLLSKETHILRSRFSAFRETGVFSFTLQIPESSATLRVSASFTDAEGTVTGDTLEGQANFSPRDRHLHVTSSSEKGIVGEFAIFHIRSNFPMEKFHYLIISKGIMVHSATEQVSFSGAEQVATIGLAVARSMYPVLTFVAFHVDSSGEMVTGTIKLPVEVFHTLRAELVQNQRKDHSKSTVETFLMAEPGSYVAASGCRQISFTKQPRNRLTKGRFLKEALLLEPLPRLVSQVARIPRNSPDPATLWLYSSSDVGGDALRTLQEAALATLTDRRFITQAEDFIGHCDMSLGYLECGDGSCFRISNVCNGITDCSDGRDEEMCHYEYYPDRSHRQGIPEEEEYRLLRVNLWKDYFDAEDGDWAWYFKFVGHGQDEAENLNVPKTQDDWVIEGFATHNEFGFTIIPPLTYNSDPPFFLVLESTSTCRRGEQISIRIAVLNSMEKDLIGMIVLPNSEDYEFIHVEEFGVVAGYRPRTSSGEHQHLVFVPAGETMELFMPLAIKKQEGLLQVTIQLITQVSYDEETIDIIIRPEGAPIRKHTSALLDLKSRALFYEFLNIPLDESPEISFKIARRFVYGSPEARLTVSGDVFGPITEDISVHHIDAFEGRSLKSTDGLAFNFGATIWTLHYLRLTNQLVLTEAVSTFSFLNTQMAGMLTRFVNGGFKMWHFSTPSVWLTAWCTNLLSAALLEDWENHIYIDPRVLTDAVIFLLEHQNPNGYFYETEYYNITLDSKYSHKFQNHADNITIGLTALATATIKEVAPSLPGPISSLAMQAVRRSTKFLERALRTLSDPHDIAITSWALMVVGSSEQDIAVSILLSHIIPQDGFLYWSKERITSNARVFENNQRTFLLPKEPQEWDAAAVEATSYALLTLLRREGVTPRQERIVSWLVSVRDWDFAFVSTVDSVVALKALTEYCYRARLRDVTDLKVDIHSSSSSDFRNEMHIEKPFVSALKYLFIPNPWGHLILTARGSGQAIAQLTTRWGVDNPQFMVRRPPRDYFSLTVREYHHIPRNKSRITTTVCTRWLAEDFSASSHSAMLEVEVPSGYFLYQQEANQRVRQLKLGDFPEMHDCLVTDNFIYFQFSHIPALRKCFTYELYRWHPVANLTLVRSAMIFEIFSPEHFEQVVINSTVLHALDICEVCGSYQCPYCYFYNRSTFLESSLKLLVAALIASQSIFMLLMGWSPGTSASMSILLI